MKHTYRLCAQGGMQKGGVEYWETYAPVVNWIIVRSLLSITRIHEFPSRSINFVLAFLQAGLYLDVFVYLPLGMGFYGNR